MNLLRFLLFPFALLYGVIVFIRNKFYDWGFFTSNTFSFPIISVGNLEVGGSGKTPMVAYLVHLLQKEFKIATLSRGYGRKTKGFKWVKPDDTALETGDEALQLKRKFQDISVAVCENRVFGVQEIIPQHQLILLDDAYQHRALKPGFSILLFDYHQLKKTKLLLPAGNYRESFNGRKRADLIVVTKSPLDISLAERQKISADLNVFAHQNIFFSHILYDKNLVHLFNRKSFKVSQITPKTTIFLLTGIAKPTPLLIELKKHSHQIIHHAYADHHQFSPKNMLKLASEFKNLAVADKIIITTEKDAVRLQEVEIVQFIKDLPIYEWPIAIDFNNQDKTEFDQLIKNYAYKT
jgi:tetraacyldisaccharide 4'-kinase